MRDKKINTHSTHKISHGRDNNLIHTFILSCHTSFLFIRRKSILYSIAQSICNPWGGGGIWMNRYKKIENKLLKLRSSLRWKVRSLNVFYFILLLVMKSGREIISIEKSDMISICFWCSPSAGNYFFYCFLSTMTKIREDQGIWRQSIFCEMLYIQLYSFAWRYGKEVEQVCWPNDKHCLHWCHNVTQNVKSYL